MLHRCSVGYLLCGKALQDWLVVKYHLLWHVQRSVYCSGRCQGNQEESGETSGMDLNAHRKVRRARPTSSNGEAAGYTL